AGGAVGEEAQEVRVRADEPVPDVEYLVEPVGEELARAPERRAVLVAEEHRLLELGELLERDRRARDGVGAVRVAGDRGGRGHGLSSSCRGRQSAQSSRSCRSPKGASTNAQWWGRSASSWASRRK